MIKCDIASNKTDVTHVFRSNHVPSPRGLTIKNLRMLTGEKRTLK